MANGGVVPEFDPPESEEVSDLLGSLSDYTLPSVLQSTDSGILPEGYKANLQGETPELTSRSLDAIPDSLQDLYGLKKPEFQPVVPMMPIGASEEKVAELKSLYDSQIENFNVRQAENGKNLGRFFREADPNTIGTTFNNEYDLSEIKLSKERLPVNLSSLDGQSNRANVEFQDVFGNLTVESFLDQVRNEVLVNSNSDVENYKQRIKEIEAKGFRRGGASLEERAEYGRLKGLSEAGELTEEGMALQMKIYGGAAIDNLIIKNIALPREQWEKLNDAKKGDTYEEYLELLETRVFNDSIKDPKFLELSKELFGDTQQEGVIAIRPFLDPSGNIKVGKSTDRDEYWSQLGVNMEMGWYDALRGVSKFRAKARRFMVDAAMHSVLGPVTTARGNQFTKEIAFSQKIADEKAIKYERQLSNNMRDLSKEITQIAVGEEVLDAGGESVFFNRSHITDLESNALTKARKLAYRTEIAMPSWRSMPLSLMTQAMSIPAYALTGLYGGFAFQSTLMGGVAGSVYYDDVLSNDRLFGKLTDNEKTWYGFSHGFGEFAGELTGNLILGKALGIGKLGGKSSLYNKFSGVNLSGKTVKFTERSFRSQVSKTLQDMVVGTAFASAIGYGEERFEETITGYWQKANERAALGLDFDHWANWDEANLQGRIGGHGGIFFSSGIRAAQNTAAMYHRSLDRATFDQKSRQSLLNQVGNDWQQGLTKSEWTEIRKNLKDMGLTPGMSSLQHAGIWGKEENKDKVIRVNELMEKFEGDRSSVSELVAEAGEDPANNAFLTAMIVDSNLMKMHDALSMEVRLDESGRPIDQRGRLLPKEWMSSYFGKKGAKLTPEQRKDAINQRKLHRGRLKMFQLMLKNNLMSQGFSTSGLDTQEQAVDRTQNPLDLESRDKNNNLERRSLSVEISEETKASLKDLGLSNQVIEQFENIIKENPDLEIITHSTLESIGRISEGVEGLYLETEKDSLIDNEGNMVKKKGKELHVFVGEGADISRVLTHEYGHLAFERFINGELLMSEESWNDMEGKKEGETYADYVKDQKAQGENFLNAMAQQITEMKDPKIQQIVEFTLRAEGLGDTERGKQVVNKELVNNFMEAIARGEFVRRGKDGNFSYNVQGVSLKDSDMGFKNWGKKLLMDFGYKGDLDFSREDDVIMLALKFSERARALKLQEGETAQEAQTEAVTPVAETEDTEGLLKSKRVDPADIDFSQGGITLYYTQNVIGQKRGVYAPIFVETDRDGEIKDRAWFKPIENKSHLEYWYAGKTGNGQARVAISDLHYYDGDTRVDINSPNIVERYGKPVFRSLPTTVSDLKIKKRKRIAKDRAALISERDKLSQHMADIHFDSEKKIGWNTNANDFLPIPKEIGIAMPEGTTEQIEKDIENYTIGIANVEALIASDLGQAELAEMAGGKTENIDTSKYPEVFNMSGLRMSETFEEKADRLNNEIQEYGAAWQLLPKESQAYKNRIPDLRVASQEDLDYASDRMDRLKAGEALEGDLLDLNLTDDIGLASSRVDLNKENVLFSSEATEKNFQEFLSGAIKSGRVKNFDELKRLLKLAGFSEANYSLHNVDQTRTGRNFISYRVGKTRYKSTFVLAGGPLGSAQVSYDGGNLVHNNTDMETAGTVQKYAKTVFEANNNNPYLLGLALLSRKNSLKNPQVFLVANTLLKNYLSNAPKQKKKAIEILNSFFENSYSPSSEEIAFNRALDTTTKFTMAATTNGQRYSGFYELDRMEGIDTSGYGLKIENEKGLKNLLDFFSKIPMKRLTEVTNFKLRGDFVSHIFKPEVGMSQIEGFPSREKFLDAVNQPEYKNLETGSVVNMTMVNVADTRRTDDISETIKERTETGSISRKLAKNIAYDFGVTGHITTWNFENAIPNGELYQMEARQGTSGFQEIGLKSRRLPGRIYMQGNSSWEQSAPTMYGAALEHLAIKLQDKFSGVMLLQQDVEKFRGSKVPQSQDFEMSMDIMYGMVRTDLERLEGELERINTTMEESGLTAEQVSDYLYAKHAGERNIYINSKRPEMLDGSGMTTQEAEDIIDELETPEMVAVAKLVYDIAANTRKTMVEGGLEKASTIETYEGLYKNYVPLSGLAADEIDDENNNYPTGGAGMAIYGKTTKAAKGRASKTGVNLIANVIMQNAMVKQRARKDQAMLSLYNLTKNNPNEKVWGVYSAKNPRMKTDETGQQVGMNAFEMKASPNMVPIRINGEQHFIYFKKKDYADALNGMTSEKLGVVGRKVTPLMNLMRNSFTQYNPAFFVGNYFRDVHGAIYNVLAEVEREGGIMQGYGINSKDFTKDVIKGSFTTLRALLNESAFGREMSEEMKEYLNEWKAAGGRTGFSYSETINNVMENMRSKAETKTGLREGAEFVFKKPIDFFEYIAALNESFENSIRLSAYIEARKVGVTKQRAAQLSKNVTINFNKSGELTPALNNMFLFFNASVQGMTRFGRTFQQGEAYQELSEVAQEMTGKVKDLLDELPDPPSRTHEESLEDLPNNPDETPEWKTRISGAQKLAAASVLVSAMETMVNIALSDRDEDDELVYNKIPEYKKERGFNIMVNGKDYLSLPLGYGYNMFNVIGMLLAEVACGQRDVDDAAIFAAISGHSSFSPIAFGHSETLGGSILKGVMPTVLKSPADAFAFNQTYFGGQVYREQTAYGVEKPASTLSFRSPEIVQQATTALSEMTGGTENIDGTIEWNADPYYYILQSYWGGAGDFVEESLGMGRAGFEVARRKYNKLASSANSDEFVDNLLTTPQEDRPIVKFSDVPVLKTIYGGPSRWYDFDLFEENRKNIEQYDKELRKGKETPGNLDFTGVQELKRQLKMADKALKQVWDARKQVRDIEDFIDRSNATYQIQEIERKIVMQFNKAYYDLRGQYVDPKPEGIIPMDKIRKAIGTDE